jgi:hypothetical protein
MKSLTDLYKKEPLAQTLTDALADAGLQPPPAPPAPAPAPAPAKKEEEPKQVMETPPGLPQEYIDANLLNQSLPPVLDMDAVAQEKAKPLNVRLTPNESLINATDIPYSPGTEPRVVRERIDQGPRVFVTSAQRDKFEKDFDEKKPEASISKTPPKLAHPDTLKPGTHIKGESPAYRPG